MNNFLISIKSKVKIEDVLNERGVYPNRRQENKLVYKCPLHSGDNSPSFYVYNKDSGDDFYCYGCKAGGNVIQLVKLLNNCNNFDAVKIVSEKAGISCDPYFYDINFDIGEMSDYENKIDIDLIMLYITSLYRNSKHNDQLDMVNKIDSKWAEIDNSYWKKDFNKLKGIYEWINGK